MALPAATFKLTGQNYGDWRRRIELYLRAHRVYSCVEQEKPANNDGGKQEKWERENAVAIHLIHETVTSEVLYSVGSCSTAQEMLSKIEKIFGKKTKKTLTLLMLDLMNLRLNARRDCEAHIAKVSEIFERMSFCDHKPDDGLKVAYFVATMGEPFQAFVAEITALPGLSFEDLLQRLRGECADDVPGGSDPSSQSQRRRNGSGFIAERGTRGRDTQPPPRQPQVTCYRCNSRGHIATHCAFPKEPSAHGGSPQTAMGPHGGQPQKRNDCFKGGQKARNLLTKAQALATTINNDVDKNAWRVDSGCSVHSSSYKP